MTLQSLPRLMAALLAVSLLVLAGTAQGAAPALPAAAPLDDATLSAEGPQRLRMRVSDEELSQMNFLSPEEFATFAAAAPTSTDYNFIRPGQNLLVTIPNDGTYICTSSFIFKDNKTPVSYYLGAAGHCFLPATATATVGAGAYNPSGVVVRACVSGCQFGGQLSGFMASMATVGPVVYARQTSSTAALGCVSGDIGNDFGFVKIDPIYYTTFAWVKTSMAVWGGPYGSASNEGTGNVLVHHGSGITWGTTEPTKARAGVSLNDGILCSFQALINVAGGDSGSAISFGGPLPNPALGGTQALGTITHGIVYAGSPAFGTTMFRMVQMGTEAGLTLTLCDATTTIPGC